MEMILTSDATERIREYLDSQGKSDDTIRAYVSDVTMFFRQMEIEEIKLDDLERTAASWLNKYRRTMAPKTTSRRLTSMRTLGLVYNHPILLKYSAPTPAPAKPHPLPEGKDDLQKMLDQCTNDDQRVLVTLLGMCGLRMKEARTLSPFSIDLRNRTIKVLGKGNRERIVPISPAAWEVIAMKVMEAQLERRETLISYADRSARHCITILASRANVTRRVASHDLRATFATEVYRNSGNDIRVAQELLGHANLKDTQVYVGNADEALKNAVNFMDKD